MGLLACRRSAVRPHRGGESDAIVEPGNRDRFAFDHPWVCELGTGRFAGAPGRGQSAAYGIARHRHPADTAATRRLAHRDRSCQRLGSHPETGCRRDGWSVAAGGSSQSSRPWDLLPPVDRSGAESERRPLLCPAAIAPHRLHPCAKRYARRGSPFRRRLSGQRSPLNTAVNCHDSANHASPRTATNFRKYYNL